jgi:hypothetical protein
MPQFLVPIISAIGTAVGGVVGAGMIMYAGAIAYGLVLVGTLALSQYQKRKAERAARAQFDAAQVDRFANVPTTVAPRELVLGRVRKGGHVFFRSSVGQFKETFVMCIAVAAHEIDGIEQIYLNDVPVSLDGLGNVTTAPYARQFLRNASDNMFSSSIVLAHTPIAASVRVIRSSGVGQDSSAGGQDFTLTGSTVDIGTYDAQQNYTVSYQWVETLYYARVYWHLGAPGQAADARLQAFFPGVWTANHRADGIAYLQCEFVYDETAFPSGLPNVTALVRGAKLYDPRTGLTQFSENPAIMMRHVLTHPQFGKRTSISAAEDARIIAAANACDTAFSYTGSDLVQMYRAATVHPFGGAARDALDDLAQAMGGEWAYGAGGFFVRAGVYQAPVMSLTDSDLAVVKRGNDGSTSQSPISISAHRARNEKINSVVARIWDQAAGYVQTPIMPMRVDAYVTDDGAELTQEVTMPAVFYAYQAFHIAGIMLRDSRDPLMVVLPFKLTAYPLELFDGVTLTLSRYGWVSKEFRVMARVFMPDGTVQCTLKETVAAIFQWGADFVPGGYASNTGLPRPWEIYPPTVTSISSGEADLIVQADGTVTNGVRVTWDAVPDASINTGGVIEVQYSIAPNGAWRGLTVPGNDTQAVFTGIPDLAIIAVRARSRSSVAVSDWSVQVWHTVIGKTEPPPNIENLSISGSVLSWSLPRRVPDLAGFVFRFHYGSNLDWNSAAPLHTGVVTEAPYDLITRPGGVVTIMGKAMDTSGNMSLASANIVMNLGDPPVANVVEEWDFDALGWPFAASESSGWTIVGGDPSADALDSFYGTDDQSFYGPDVESFFEASAYGQMVYVTPEISVISALAGSIMTLQAVTLGIDLHIEYRLVGPGSFYGPDGASFFGDDAEPFYGGPGGWLPWPGQIIAANDVYQFRITIGAGPTRGVLQSLTVTIDAPDLEESLADVVIANVGTAVPYTKTFTAIRTVQATLQANGSGAETVEIDKSAPLVPVIRAFNSAHAGVSGATADIVLRGY